MTRTALGLPVRDLRQDVGDRAESIRHSFSYRYKATRTATHLEVYICTYKVTAAGAANTVFSLLLLVKFSHHIKTRIELPGLVCRHGRERWLTRGEKQQPDKATRGIS